MESKRKASGANGTETAADTDRAAKRRKLMEVSPTPFTCPSPFAMRHVKNATVRVALPCDSKVKVFVVSRRAVTLRGLALGLQLAVRQRWRASWDTGMAWHSTAVRLALCVVEVRCLAISNQPTAQKRGSNLPQPPISTSQSTPTYASPFAPCRLSQLKTISL